MKYIPAIFLIPLILIIACGEKSPIKPIYSEYTLSELLHAPTVITLEDRQVMMDCQMTLNLMPIIPSAGPPFLAVFRIRPVDSLKTLPAVELVHAWVILGENSRQILRFFTFEDMGTPDGDGSNQLVKLGRTQFNTPENVAQVVVLLEDSRNTPHLLRAARQPIWRVY